MTCTIERLERRRLLAGDFEAGFALPYVLDFNRSKTGLFDRDGSGTGMTWAQPNKDGDEYQPRLVDLKIGVGVLRLYSTGTADAGSNFEGDNTLVNNLTARFSASSKPWVISARVNGPIPQIDEPHEQGGITFGPDQDNFVKLVVAAEGGKVGLQFLDEQKFKSGYKHYLSDQIFEIGSLSSISTIDLYLAGDPTVGYVRALYRINGGTVKELPATLILKGDKRAAFFSPAGFAGVMAQHKNNGAGIDFTFDQFAIQRGVLTGELPQQPGSGQITTASRRVFNDVLGGTGQTIGVSVRNDGDGPLTIPAGALSISGTDASMFSASTVEALPITLQAGQSAQIKLTFTAPAGTGLGIKTATLAIQSNDPDTPVKNVSLRGLATAGTGGTNEPSLQRILDLYEIPDNVGDTNPSDVYIGDPPATPNDEISLQQLKKAGPGNVTIQPIAVFGVSSSPALRMGYYDAGSPAKTTELMTIATADAQTVNPVPNGVTSFDPGSAGFGFYSIWPGFANTDGSIRTIYQEDLFNTFDTHQPRHIRFYPLKNADGSTVPNAYIMAHEEFPGGYDSQDFVAIITNVTSASAGPEIGTDNLDGPPAPDRLVFTKFRSGDPLFPATTAHTQAKVRVRNTGTANLNISSVGVTGAFSVLSNSGAQSIQPGKFADVLVQFNGGTATGVLGGSLTINSNDADEPAKVINLAGYHQVKPEGDLEPTTQQIVNGMFGYGTTLLNAGQSFDGDGKVAAVGEEVLSPYWFRANSLVPVTVKQMWQYHTQGNVSLLQWFNKSNSNVRTTLFTAEADDAQTLYPRIEGTTSLAQTTFTPGTGSFGFLIDNAEWSDDAKNVQEQPGGGWGHHVRFFPLRTGSGQLVPDTYLMVMDYNGINYDYNDNGYIISNIRPETVSAAVPSQAVASALPPAWGSTASFASTPLDAAELLDITIL